MQVKTNFHRKYTLNVEKLNSLPVSVIPVCAVIICFITRLLYFGRYIDEWDSVNFAFGLSKGYDILHDQPHFPGYPVYMFVSWIWYKLCGSDIKALIFSGILFSSLAVYPLFELARKIFSRKVAVLTAVLYTVNPQIWLQAEKPLSDAFGLFFVIASAWLFYNALERTFSENLPSSLAGHNNNENVSLALLAWGGGMLGLGIGVRVTYLAMIPFMGFTMYQISKKVQFRKVVIWGMVGLSLGVFSWLGYLVARFFPLQFYKKFLNHADYHFCREGNSILTTDDFGERYWGLFYKLSAHCLGTWWIDTPLLRIVPTLIIIASLFYFFKYAKWNPGNKFLLAFFVPYILWVALIQDAVRQVMVLTPFLVIVISAGFVKIYQHSLKDMKYGFPFFLSLFFVFALTLALDSLGIVKLNRNEEPPSVKTIKYITEKFTKNDTKFYCLNDWRLFQYYAPEWCDKRNSHVYFVSHMDGVKRDLKRLRRQRKKPKYILISSKLFGRHKYKNELTKLAEFQRDRYGVADYNWLVLYQFKRRKS